MSMLTLQKLGQLSGPHCVLLAVQYATQSNIKALRALTALRDTDLPLELTLSILLTYLPERIKPVEYVSYLHALGTDSRDPGDDPTATLDLSSIQDLSIARARKRQKALYLLPVSHPLYAAEYQLDPFSHFLIHRAHRIDAETGLLELVSDLIIPFLDHSEYVRTWFISTVIPLIRLGYEDYPQRATATLDELAQLEGKQAIDFLLSDIQHTGRGNVARDLKGVVAPWLCGANDRKRRKPSGQAEHVDDWTCLFQWIVQTSKQSLQLASVAINEWDGPEDMDLGGFEAGRDYVDDEQQRRLEMQYAQTALACLYLIDTDHITALQTAHSLLRRICDLLNYDPPPDVSIGIERFPSYDLQEPLLHAPTPLLIQEHRLLDRDNPLTKPSRESIQLLKLILFSAYILSSLKQPVPLKELTKVWLRGDRSEQLSLLQKILHTLGSTNQDSEQWANARLKLLWLWNWASCAYTNQHAPGILGMLESNTLESKLLEALLEGGHYPLAVQTYVHTQTTLPLHEVETVVLKSAMHHYDNASNCNRTRGGMKRANDIIMVFGPHFTHSQRFHRVQALIAATHAMSSYSLILEHGVPFQPVNIRVSSNPLSLIQKLLSQNHQSYTKLDDLIFIGRNLAVSTPSTIMDAEESTPLDSTAAEEAKITAERCVIGMAIDAALDDHDFETAFSYVVSRLTPPTPTSRSPPLFSYGQVDTEEHEEAIEDIAWRATLRAGRYHPTQKPASVWSFVTQPNLRWMEQRMELLAQALMLAPSAHLEGILSEWRQCEAEYIAMLAEEEEAEARFDDAADRRLPGTFFNDLLTVQPRREVAAAEEAPIDLFSVARGVAAAVSKSAFPLRRGAAPSHTAMQDDTSSSRVSMDMSDSGSMSHEDRVRKRDMMANVATGALASGTGALASGLGWMLGAKPVHEHDQQ